MRFIIPLKLSSWNDTIKYCRGNKFGANYHKKKEMRDISMFMRDLPIIEEYPVRMVFKWHIKRCMDLDNKSVKSILDEMQNLGILENDDMKHINEIKHIAIKDSDDYVEVEIERNVDEFS